MQPHGSYRCWSVQRSDIISVKEESTYPNGETLAKKELPVMCAVRDEKGCSYEYGARCDEHRAEVAQIEQTADEEAREEH